MMPANIFQEWESHFQSSGYLIMDLNASVVLCWPDNQIFVHGEMTMALKKIKNTSVNKHPYTSAWQEIEKKNILSCQRQQ